MIIEKVIDKKEELKDLLEYKISPEIFEQYGIQVMDIMPKRGIYRIESKEGIHCLKKIKYNKKDLYFIYQGIQHLEEKGFKRACKIRKTLENSLYVEDGKDLYIMMDWVNGRECNYENPMDLSMAVKTLRDLHHASRGFWPIGYRGKRDILGKWPEIFKNRSKDIKDIKEIVVGKDKKNEFDEIFLEYVDGYYEDSIEAIESFERFQYNKIVQKALEDRGFCHNDYAYHNLLISYDQGEVIVLDFDYFLFDLRINDIGSMIHRNLKKCNWDIKRAQFILDIYEEEEKLDEDEWKGLYVYFKFPIDFWRISYQYYIEKKNWDEEIFINRMIEKAGCSPLRKDFLKNFKEMTGM